MNSNQRMNSIKSTFSLTILKKIWNETDLWRNIQVQKNISKIFYKSFNNQDVYLNTLSIGNQFTLFHKYILVFFKGNFELKDSLFINIFQSLMNKIDSINVKIKYHSSLFSAKDIAIFIDMQLLLITFVSM